MILNRELVLASLASSRAGTLHLRADTMFILAAARVSHKVAVQHAELLALATPGLPAMHSGLDPEQQPGSGAVGERI